MSQERLDSNLDRPMELLDFMVPVDGSRPEISEAEESLVAEKFKTLVEDTLLNHILEVVRLEATEQDKLSLVKLDEADLGWTLGVYGTSDSYEPPNKPEPEDDVRDEIVFANPKRGQYFSYRLCADGVVRRHDGSRNIASGRSKAERQLGINDQPIGLAEMEGLEGFIAQPGFEIPTAVAF